MLNAEQLRVVNSVNSRQELREMWDALKWRAKQLDAVAAAQFGPGDRVWFVGRHRQTEVGTVTRMHGRSVSVLADSGMKWRVAPTLLRRVTADGRLTSAAL